MKIIVKYSDFHWNNYQGGVGKFVNGICILEIPDGMDCGQLESWIDENLRKHVHSRRPFEQHEIFTVQSMELV